MNVVGIADLFAPQTVMRAALATEVPPGGLRSTLPEPLTFVVRVNCWTAKVAVTFLSASNSAIAS